MNRVSGDSEGVVPLIEMTGICKSFGGDSPKGGAPPIEVLNNVNLRVESGEFIAIVGTSGSGKSTLMNLLGCLDKTTSGVYKFWGKDVSCLDTDGLAKLRREEFGFIFQSYNLISTESARENVEVPALYAGLPKHVRTERATSLLNRLGLGDKFLNLPKQLSGGQQQRVSIARALMNGGRIILADEPTGALDSRSGIEVMDLLKELAAAGHTIILITHDRSIAEQAHRIIEISDGRITSDHSKVASPEPSSIKVPSMELARLDSAHSIMDEIAAALRAAWRVMWISRFRTFLTLLGIIIGVASVTVMMAIGNGSQQEIMAKMSAFGARTLQVWPQWSTSQIPSGKIHLDDLLTIRRLPNVVAVAPYIEDDVTIRRGNLNIQAEVGGTTVDYLETMNWQVSRGDFFNQEDDENLEKVAVIGETVRKKLFVDGTDPLGQDILIESVPFQVIGILAEKGANEGNDQDNRILMPFSTASVRLFGRQNPNWIGVLTSSIEVSKATGSVIEEALEKSRGLPDLEVWDRAEAIRVQSETGRSMALMLGLIAAVSLVVGGIGVMNVMLMSIRERTREIGIRIATGARQIDIMRQFLSEAVLVTSVGGMIGIFSGGVIGMALWLSDVPLAFSWDSMLIALACSVGSGLIFGYIPALQAARLNPVQALSAD